MLEKMCSCCKNLRPADLPTLTDYAYFSCISLCYYAVRQFLPQANSLFFLISFNYSRNLVSSNTCLHINVNLWVKNVKLIHHWHLEKTIFCNLAHKMYSLREAQHLYYSHVNEKPNFCRSFSLKLTYVTTACLN